MQNQFDTDLDGDHLCLPSLDNLMSHYGDDLWTYAFSLVRNRATADDLIQEVFLRCWLYRSQFRAESSVKTWLFAITKNVCRDYFRSAYRRRVQLVPNEDLASMGQPSQYHSDGDMMQLDIWNAVMKLGASYREVLVLRLREDLSFADISKVTGITEGVLRIRYQRALRKLRTRLEEGDAL